MISEFEPGERDLAAPQLALQPSSLLIGMTKNMNFRSVSNSRRMAIYDKMALLS